MKDISIIIQAVDRFSAPLRRAATIAGGLSAIYSGTAMLIAKSFVRSAAEFERFTAILETVEGSSELARKSMSWVSDFAAKTPFELKEVTDAYVKLRAYGLDPTNGLLKTLGDTAAAMGKPLLMGVEAMADAVTGENERLKEFGIKARTLGKSVVYEYTANGKTMRRAAQVGNREQIQQTLQAIWNEKYAGAMDKQSKTWIGMMSNISDQVTRFKVMVMGNGAFDFLKDKLGGILGVLDEMAANGQLQEFAKTFSGMLVVGLKMAELAMRGLWMALKIVGMELKGLWIVVNWVADLFGGFENVAIGLAVVFTGPLLQAIWAVTLALKAMVMAHPLLALAAVALMIVANWESVSEFFKGLWDSLVKGFEMAANFIGATMNTLLQVVLWPLIKVLELINNLLPESVQQGTSLGRALNTAVEWGNGKSPSGNWQTAAPGGNAGGRDTNMSLKVEIDNKGRAIVREMKSSNDAVDFEVDTGLLMAN